MIGFSGVWIYLFVCLLVWDANVLCFEMKSKFWLTKASRVRSSVWKVGDKRPGKPSAVVSSLSKLPSLFSFVILRDFFVWGVLLGYNASDSDSDELDEDS